MRLQEIADLLNDAQDDIEAWIDYALETGMAEENKAIAESKSLLNALLQAEIFIEGDLL